MELRSMWELKYSNYEEYVAYGNMLRAFGYEVPRWRPGSTSFFRGSQANPSVICDKFFTVGRRDHKRFDNVKEFIMWHCTPEMTPQQKQIAELKETIQKAQEQIERLERESR